MADVPVSREWLEENPDYDAADAVLLARLIFAREERDLHLTFLTLDGRDGSPLNADVLFRIWEALGTSVEGMPDVTPARRELLRTIRETLEGEGAPPPVRVDAPRRRGRAKPPFMTDEESLAVVERAKAYVGEVVVRAFAEGRPLSEYCVLIGFDPPPPGVTDGIGLRIDELKSALPKKKDHLGVMRAIEGKVAREDQVLLVVTREGEVDVSAVTVEKVEVEKQSLH
jgi:hypothetical protein